MTITLLAAASLLSCLCKADLDAAEDHALAAEGHMRAAVHELSDAEVSATKARRRKVCIALVVGLVVAGLAAFLAIWLSR